jgi:hypothetical protein
VIGMELCDWNGAVCLEWSCVFGMELCDWNGAVCLEWSCVFGMELCVWNGAVCLEWSCVFGMELYDWNECLGAWGSVVRTENVRSNVTSDSSNFIPFRATIYALLLNLM